MIRYSPFIASVVLLVWSAARMSVLWTIAAYVVAGLFWLAHERQKHILDQAWVATTLKPLFVVALWPVNAGCVAILKIKSLTSAERYLVYWGGLRDGTGQQAHFRTWRQALSFARQKARERALTAARPESVFPGDHVGIIDYGRLRPDRMFGGLRHASFVVEDSGAIQRIV